MHFAADWKAAYDVKSDGFVNMIVSDDTAKFRYPASIVLEKFDPKPSVTAFSAVFFATTATIAEAAGDVISCVAVEQVGRYGCLRKIW